MGINNYNIKYLYKVRNSYYEVTSRIQLKLIKKMSLIKLNIYNYIVTFLFFSFTNLGFSQEILNYNNFVTINEDLTNQGITSIFKDNDGYVWIGTYGDGLFKYNSINFKNYKQQWNSKGSSLNSSIIHSILQDKQNKIWVGTQNGLNLYNSDFDKFESINLLEDKKQEPFSIHSIEEYSDDILFLGTHGQGLIKFNKKSLNHKSIPYKKNSSLTDLLINAIVKSPNGKFLIGTNQGLMTFDPNTEVFERAKFNTQNGLDTVDDFIQSLLISKDNSIWVGTFSSGLTRIFENDNGFYILQNFPISNKRIMSLSERSATNILCGTENDGLFDVNYASGSVKNYRNDKSKHNGIKSNSIWKVYIDEKNRIWLGYYNSGIDVYDNNYNKFNSIKSYPFHENSLNSNSVTSIVKDDKGRLWLGMEGGGIDVYDPIKKTFINLSNQNNIAEGLNSLNITTVFIDRKKNIWVGTWDMGLFLLKRDKKKFINKNNQNSNGVFKSNRIMSFAEDSEGTIWIGTYLSGLYSYSPISETFTHQTSSEIKKHNINTTSIRKIFIDREDNMWLGTIDGLFRIKKTGANSYKVSSLNEKMNRGFDGQVPTSIIASLYQDKNNQLWIGTIGNGLYSYNISKDSLEWHNIKTGLLNENIYSITQDASGNLWIGGNSVLSKLNIKEKTFKNFTKKDGLLSNSFNFNSVYESSNGELYFGNSKGINYFNPDRIIYNQEKPIVYISNLKLSNELVYPNTKDSPLEKVISKTSSIVLNHNQTAFTLTYSGINYTRGKNNQYAYYLDGLEDEWNYVGSYKEATYKNIPPGDYTFKVKASNNDGIWNDIPTTLSIKILPAWWATRLAILSYILFTLLLSYIIYRIVLERSQEKRMLYFEREKHQQFEALNDKKIQFFTNISHEFKTPLTLILTPLEDIIEQGNTQFSNEIKEKHNIIYKNAKRLSRLINELMDFRKLQFNKMSINASLINLIPFIEEITSHYEEEAISKNIILSVEYEETDISIWSDPSMLEKIIFNLLSNAFKATPEGGLITVRISNPKDSILLPLVNENEPVMAAEIIVKDTGRGIKDENIDKVFDRFYQVDEMNNQYYGGTGIGLELVKDFIDLHKGKIVLTSKEGFGTEFKIYFPQGYSHLKEGNVNNKDKKAINQYSEFQKENLDKDLNEPKSTSKKRLLIIEDNTELRTYLKNELKYEYYIKEAENGLEGLEKANKYIPDVIITDIMMPIMDGFELCQRIKNDLKTSHIPLLMITAKGLQIDKVRGIDFGADIYLNKPFNMKVLKSHLNQLIISRQILFDKYFNGLNNDIVSENTTSLDMEFINNLLIFINDNISDENLNVENLAEKLLLSRSKLYRKIKALTGGTANEFIRKIRLEKSKNLIENSEYTISEICYKVGFSSPSYFTKCFKEYFDILPTEIRFNKECNTTEL